MSRTVIIVATLGSFVAIGITIWLQVQGQTPPMPIGAGAVPQQYDTTGGQEMRPRCDSEGQSNDAAGN